MIDYSVYMTPNPMNEEAAPMAYGRAQMRESMTFDKFVKHIAEAFTAANIKGINVVFTPGADFEGMRDKAVFNPVASRLAQAATLKAEKSGSTIVDLEAAKQKPAASEGTGA